MPTGEHFESLRDLVLELGVATAAQVEECATASLTTRGAVSTWAIMRERGYLPGTAADTLELVSRGYLPSDSARAALVAAVGSDFIRPRPLPAPVPPTPPPSAFAPRPLGELQQPAPGRRPGVQYRHRDGAPAIATRRPVAPAPDPRRTTGAAETPPSSEMATRPVGGAGLRDPVPPAPSAVLGIVGYEIVGLAERDVATLAYLARAPHLAGQVHVVVPDPVVAACWPKWVERLGDEARAALRINHPGVRRVLDCASAGTEPFVALEILDGMTCADLLAVTGVLPEARALGIAKAAAEALEAAHEAGVLHRNITPAALVVTRTRTVKVAGIGIAKLLGSELPPGSQGAPIGQLHAAYAAPEQASNPGGAGIHADIYSLGATLFHLLTGQPPFRAATAMQLVYRHVSEPVAPPSTIVPAVSAEASTLVRAMMAKSPADRPTDYAELIRRIESALVTATSGGGPGAPLGSLATTATRTRR